MGVNHRWDAYLKHVLLHGNPTLVDKLMRNRFENKKSAIVVSHIYALTSRPEFNQQEGEEDSGSSALAAKELAKAWKKRREEWTGV